VGVYALDVPKKFDSEVKNETNKTAVDKMLEVGRS
jgi:hypothetical protein